VRGVRRGGWGEGAHGLAGVWDATERTQGGRATRDACAWVYVFGWRQVQQAAAAAAAARRAPPPRGPGAATTVLLGEGGLEPGPYPPPRGPGSGQAPLWPGAAVAGPTEAAVLAAEEAEEVAFAVTSPGRGRPPRAA
jgi:hypothetical protein